MSSRLTPSEDFPDDLTALDLTAVEVLNSRIHRELDHEYAHDGAASTETEIRHEEVTEELDRRDRQPGSTPLVTGLEATRQYS
ncbi:hypothetical protein AC792_12140 [Arthrobacter sp. RIT-PI-e]|uniref:hypothetical protein n=1 Tax=Arthrobacter sp. RIT-PI-e TaxID=1681197 RepID=UPI000675E93E|nr:hypothetical protein [Arthrobacter sp. RIT-PI-e]KNC18387.1 hypothetical protein AC792_12140 [Arthrobacter sp. RIT-PI-e]